MVHLSLTPLNGNQSLAKGWPFQGVFGLTRITTHGTIRTRLGDDRTPLLASKISILVRCYETRLNKLGGVVQTNVLVEESQTLWSADPSQQIQPPPFAPIGDLDLPFRFVLPPNLQGPSTCHMQEYRVFWRIEAVINHVPLVGQGTRQVKAFDLHFVRHDAPSASGASSSTFHVSSATLPSCAYSLSTPSHPIGPEDPIPVSLRVFTTQPGASLAKVAVSVERRMEVRGEPSKRSSSSSSKRDALPTPPSTASSMSSTDDPQQHQPSPLSSTPAGQPSSKSKGKSRETLNLDQLGNSMLRATKRTTSYFLGSSSSSSPSSAPSPSAPPATTPTSESPVAPSSDVAPFAFSAPTYPRSTTATAGASSPSSSASWGPSTTNPSASQQQHIVSSSFANPNSSGSNPGNSSVAPMAASGTGVVKTTTQTVASVEKAKPDFEVTADADGLAKWSLDTEELGLPVQKPGHWSLGETVSTNLVAIRFFICVKLTIATPHNSLASSGSGSGSHWTVTEVALPAQEIQVVSISAARRAYVLAKVEQTKATRAASKSAPSSTTASPTGHLLPPSSSSPSSSSGRPTRRLRSSNTHSPLGSSAEREQQKSKSKKRLRGERDKDALPSPPPSPYEFRVQLPDAASSTSSTAPLLRGYQPATKLVIPPKVDGEDDEDVSMELPAVDSDESAEAEDDDGFFVIMSGDLNLQRMSNKMPSASTRNHRATSPRAAAAGSSKSKSGREAGGSKSKGALKKFAPFKNSSRRPVTADVGRRSAEREMEVHQGYQRATSVGAVSPTGVLMLAERMGELMDLEEEEGHDHHHHHRDDEDNPFSFSPPPPEASSSTSSLPDIHVQPPSLKSLSSSPASSASTVTIRQSPVPASTSAARATMAMALLEKEWEEELMKMEAASRRGSVDMSSAGGDFAGQCRRRRTRTRELAAAEE